MIKKVDDQRLGQLRDRLLDEKEIITWRSLIIEIKKLFDVEDPEFDRVPEQDRALAKKVINKLTKDSIFELLQTEIMYATGFENVSSKRVLDALIINAVHTTEPLFLSLFRLYKKNYKKAAGFDPVGHYSDMQTRIVGPAKLYGKVKRLIFVASTQEMYDGDIAVLASTLRLLRNKDIASRVDKIDIVIPMFGGSRGHRKGQSDEIGYEVLEAIFNAKLLSLTTRDILQQLSVDGPEDNGPKVTFYSIDIHSKKYPKRTFESSGFEFVTISPSEQLADAFCKYIKEKKLSKNTIKVIACDKGAVDRTQELARSVLRNRKLSVNDLEIIYFKKYRPRAGEVNKVKMEKIEKWTVNKNKILIKQKRILKMNKPSKQKAILLYTDDMIDTGGTAAADRERLLKYYPKAVLNVFAATHPVLSKGLLALERIGADHYLLGNTLVPAGLEETDNVQIVDLAPAVINSLK